MDGNIDIKKLREAELELLDIFVHVCDQLNVRYYMIGGSLLGAVRHKGFIPWDDDIDVGIMRDDYDIFIRSAQELLPENIFLQTFMTDPEYPSLFAKLRKSDTTFIETSVSKLNINHGVYLDIFPLDNYPLGKIGQINLELFSKVVFGKLGQVYYAENYIAKKPVSQKFFEMISNVKYCSTQDALLSYESKLKKRSKTPLVRNYFGAWGKREIWQRSWFEPCVYLEFEKRKVSVPKDWNAMLTAVYGDYMTLPPKGERIFHHDTVIVDLDNTYIRYCCDPISLKGNI